MFDSQLYALLIAAIQNAEVNFGIPLVTGNPGVPIYQSYQPTQQGVPTGPCAFLQIICHDRIGQPQRADIYAAGSPPTMTHTETQVMLAQFQISALSTQDPTSTTQYTAADIVNLIAMILQNQQIVEYLESQGCGIQLASPTRNPKFLNDRDRFEASPSFDFNVTYNLIVSQSQNVLQSTEVGIFPV